jgi:hypothetical protein
MSRLLATLVAGYATIALSGAALAEDQTTRTEPPQEQNQADHTGPATVEMDGQDEQATADSDDQDEQAEINSDDEGIAVIVFPDEQDDEVVAGSGDQGEQAATDTDDQDVVVIVVPEDQDEQASMDTDTGARGAQEDQQTAQAQESQPTQNNSNNGNADGVEDTQNTAIPQPEYSAELRKCDWAQGKRRAHCIEATKKKFGDM